MDPMGLYHVTTAGLHFWILPRGNSSGANCAVLRQTYLESDLCGNRGVLGYNGVLLRGFQTETLATKRSQNYISYYRYWLPASHIHYVNHMYIYIYIFLHDLYIYIYILFLEEGPLMNKKSVLLGVRVRLKYSPKSFRLQMVNQGISAPWPWFSGQNLNTVVGRNPKQPPGMVLKPCK